MQHAITIQPRPLRAFHVSLRSAGHRLTYTALAHSSGDALGDALSMPDLDVPICASIKPMVATGASCGGSNHG